MILQNASPSELDQAIIENYHQAWLKILQVFEYPDPYELFGIHGFLSGIHYMMMNSLFDGDPRMTHIDVKEVLEYFSQNQIPMMWFLGPKSQQAGLGRILDDLDVERASMEVPGMSVDLSKHERNELEKKMGNHDIRMINPDDQQLLDGYAEIFMQAFEVDPTIRDQMRQFAAAVPSHPDSSHFYVSKDGNPVAIASVIYEAGVAGIYHIATLPEYQGQGIATALMSKLLLDAKQRGYQYSILHSSKRGKKLYENLGYRVNFWFDRYLLRPTDVGLA